MVDREKVIQKAERIMCSTVDRDMIDSFCEDVIAMLKEQEAVPVMTNKEMADFLSELRNRHEMPIDEDEYNLLGSIADFLELLKEREAQKPIVNYAKYEDHLPHCPSCEKVIPERAVYGESNFCYKCGQKLKWQ